jgi:hypothetical protein
MSAGDIKKEIDNKIYFYMEERLIFDSKIKKDTCLVESLNSPSINQKIYNKKSVSVLQGKQMEERKMKLKNQYCIRN